MATHLRLAPFGPPFWFHGKKYKIRTNFVYNYNNIHCFQGTHTVKSGTFQMLTVLLVDTKSAIV